MRRQALLRSTLGTTAMLAALAAAGAAMLLRPEARPPGADRRPVVAVPVGTSRRPVMLEAPADLQPLPTARVQMTAPAGGRVSQLFVSRGQVVAAGELLAVLERSPWDLPRQRDRRQRQEGRRQEAGGGQTTQQRQSAAGRSRLPPADCRCLLSPGWRAAARVGGRSEPGPGRAATSGAPTGLGDRETLPWPGPSPGEVASPAPPPVQIRAPRAGVIQELFLYPEQRIRTGDPVAELLDTSRLLATVHLPAETREGYLRGMPVVVTSTFFPDEIYHASVRAAPAAPASGEDTVPVEILVTSRMGQLYAGLPVMVYLRVRPPRAGLFIPSRALSERYGVPEVHVVGAGERVERRRIEIGSEAAGIVRILHGLAEGERVVMDGSLVFSDDEEVTVRAADEAGTSPHVTEGSSHWAADPGGR